MLPDMDEPTGPPLFTYVIINGNCCYEAQSIIEYLAYQSDFLASRGQDVAANILLELMHAFYAPAAKALTSPDREDIVDLMPEGAWDGYVERAEIKDGIMDLERMLIMEDQKKQDPPESP